jgi:hypothetical protein
MTTMIRLHGRLYEDNAAPGRHVHAAEASPVREAAAAAADGYGEALSRYAGYGILGGCLIGAALMILATLVTPVPGARIAAPALILLGTLLGGAVGGPYGMLFTFAGPKSRSGEADWVTRQHGSEAAETVAGSGAGTLASAA